MTIPGEMTEDTVAANLLERARGGDAEAFCQLAAEAEARLYRQALGLCGEVEGAEDLVAETLIGAWQAVARFDGGCRFSTWLYAILLNRFHKQVRRTRSRPVSAARIAGRDRERAEDALDRMADGRPSGAEAAGSAEAAGRLRAALAGLSEEHRAVLSLRFFEDASLAEIASALGVPVGTVKSRLHHGLEKLRGMAEVVNLWNERGDT